MQTVDGNEMLPVFVRWLLVGPIAKTKYLHDQVIDVTSTTDKQLPGQQGLPPAKIRVGGQDLEIQQKLPESELEEFTV